MIWSSELQLNEPQRICLVRSASLLNKWNETNGLMKLNEKISFTKQTRISGSRIKDCLLLPPCGSWNTVLPMLVSIRGLLYYPESAAVGAGFPSNQVKATLFYKKASCIVSLCSMKVSYKAFWTRLGHGNSCKRIDRHCILHIFYCHYNCCY